MCDLVDESVYVSDIFKLMFDFTIIKYTMEITKVDIIQSNQQNPAHQCLFIFGIFES